ncbi:protein HAIKU1-like isoform X3 [Telopea speciosissima]|uniref:protein HAIKU1-like isoform X3 n=1 Tax=Telopea speciosissima TaxID=54955 RepID=UPI001CC704F8|nr:protein HAIKU1-like isoform X3 [Telopea speciosissima]
MENSNLSRNRHGEHLGVNKMGKNIKKSPLHQPNFANAKPQPQPQVYNISKNDFRSIVQQLTGSPSQDPSPRLPNPSKPPSMRLQKIRPPPLTPIYRPPIPPAPAPFNNSFVRPGQIGQPSVSPMPTLAPGDQVWAANTAESPISAYMRYLQNSIIDSSPRQTQQLQPQLQAHPAHAQLQAQAQAHQFQSQAQAQPRLQGQVPIQPSSSGLLPTPPTYPYPGAPAFPSPRGNAAALLPSPTSQFLLPSPSFFSNLLSPRSPRSPYPLISPTFQYPPPLTPNFAYTPTSQSGILGPGPQPPLSPGIFFPSSPSGFFPFPSPRWRDQ